ncbi:MAG: restriction endonuclease [Euryarchaeota archaeon]|nr:restriction endonuclease [Euryarchaeota archaeon]
MNEISILQTELRNESSFRIFTKLFIKKIEGGMLSQEYLNEEEKHALDTVGFAEQRVVFDCPNCRETRHTDSGALEFGCDCGEIINLRNDDYGKRYVLSESAYDAIREMLSQECGRDDTTIKYIFGEDITNTSKHDSNVYLHISPLIRTMDTNFQCLDDAYVDHFLINWNIFPNILRDEQTDAFLSDILRWRQESIEKQIDWGKIDEWEFQNLIIEILQSEDKFSKIIPGGRGPDQGKDALGYSALQLPTGKTINSKTLIQCKYTGVGQTFSADDIQRYVMKAKRHECNFLLFITNSYLSGDTVTEIHSEAYYDKDFLDVDFWDEQEIFNLLEKYPHIRIKYFYRNSL